MKKRGKSSRFWLALVIFSLTGQVAWVVENMYFNVFVYKMFGASAGEISLMVGASAAAATVTTLLIGALSDRIGKRKLFKRCVFLYAKRNKLARCLVCVAEGKTLANKIVCTVGSIDKSLGCCVTHIVL